MSECIWWKRNFTPNYDTLNRNKIPYRMCHLPYFIFKWLCSIKTDALAVDGHARNNNKRMRELITMYIVHVQWYMYIHSMDAAAAPTRYCCVLQFKLLIVKNVFVYVCIYVEVQKKWNSSHNLIIFSVYIELYSHKYTKLIFHFGWKTPKYSNLTTWIIYEIWNDFGLTFFFFWFSEKKSLYLCVFRHHVFYCCCFA